MDGMTKAGKSLIVRKMISSTPAAVSGYPAVTVPAGFVGELPVGVSFMAGQWTDARVLAYAADFERVAVRCQATRVVVVVECGRAV